MNKFLLLLILLSANAYAQWQNIGQSETETAYVDTENIKHRELHRERMWALFDLKTPHNFGDLSYLSMKIRREYSCSDKTSRVIALQAYSKNMSAGDLIYSNNKHDEWTGIEPESVEEALWRYACETKNSTIKP